MIKELFSTSDQDKIDCFSMTKAELMEFQILLKANNILINGPKIIDVKINDICIIWISEKALIKREMLCPKAYLINKDLKIIMIRETEYHYLVNDFSSFDFTLNLKF